MHYLHTDYLQAIHPIYARLPHTMALPSIHLHIVLLSETLLCCGINTTDLHRLTILPAQASLNTHRSTVPLGIGTMS